MNSFIATPAGLEREVIIYISKGLKYDLNTAVLLSLVSGLLSKMLLLVSVYDS